MAGSNGLGKGEIRESQRSKKADGMRLEFTIASYEHPIVVLLCHWLSAIILVVMTASGLEIFRAFPSFGGKIPEWVARLLGGFRVVRIWHSVAMCGLLAFLPGHLPYGRNSRMEQLPLYDDRLEAEP